MKTFTATASFPKEDVTKFAEANGWQGNGDVADFVQDLIKTRLVEVIGSTTIAQIKMQAAEEKHRQIQEYKAQLEQIVSVSHD